MLYIIGDDDVISVEMETACCEKTRKLTCQFNMPLVIIFVGVSPNSTAEIVLTADISSEHVTERKGEGGVSREEALCGKKTKLSANSKR